MAFRYIELVLCGTIYVTTSYDAGFIYPFIFFVYLLYQRGEDHHQSLENNNIKVINNHFLSSTGMSVLTSSLFIWVLIVDYTLKAWYS